MWDDVGEGTTLLVEDISEMLRLNRFPLERRKLMKFGKKIAKPDDLKSLAHLCLCFLKSSRVSAR